ncbi:MAG: DMT family transporter [Lentisphaeraceae bacterium]|nr:DMT family transporter [Lentisphaeraceae bacterium]
MKNYLKSPITILLLGAMTCSTAVIMIKESTLHPILLAGYRLLLAGLFLTPLYFRDLKKEKKKVKETLYAFWPGVILSVHFITWVMGCRATYAANATLIVNMVPAAMPFVLFILVREVISKRELTGTLFASAGVVLLMLSDFKLSREHFIGDMICFGSMILFALYLALSRKYKNRGSIWLYTVPLFISAGLCCFVLAAIQGIMPWHGMNMTEAGHALLLAIIPTIMGHTALNYSMKVLRGQVVGVLNMTQFLWAAMYGYIFFAEIPGVAFYPSVLLLATGICIIVTKRTENEEASTKVKV